MAEAEIVLRNVATVPEVPIVSLTTAGDQGWARELVTKQINGSRDIYASVFRMDPDQYHPLHAHPNTGELYFVLEGRCEMRVGDRCEWVRAGTAAYMPRGVPHSVRTGDVGVSVLVIFPKGDFGEVEKVWME
jgi:quercetin dioxygenase-like cupin family protein